MRESITRGESSCYFLYTMGLWCEGIDNFLIDLLRDMILPTGKNIYCRILVLWPCVNGDMAFCNDDNSAEAVGAKLMNDRIYDCCASCFGTVNENI